MKRQAVIMILILSFFSGRMAGQCSLTSGAGTDDQVVCNGIAITSITYSLEDATGATVTGLPDGVSYSFTSPVVTISGTPTVSGTFDYSVTLDHATTPCTSTGRITVNPVLPVSITISESANNVCAGTSVTFTATPVNGGSSPSYQWYNGASAVGPNSPVYTYIPADGDAIRVVLTSNATCNTGSPATSNTVTMTVNALTGTPVFTAGATSICKDAPNETYTAIADNSISVSYSRSPSSSGSINSSSGVMNWDNNYSGVATITATATGLCGITTSDLFVTVYSGVPTRPASIAGNTVVCQGQAGVTYTAAVSSNTTYYEWSVPAGATIISGQGTTSIAVDFSPAATNLTISVRSGNPCGLSGSSRDLSITVRPTPTATISGTATVCQGAASPNITFANPQSLPITVTYNINGSDQTTVNVNGSSSANVPVSTTTAGTYTYILVSVAYQSGAGCSNPLTGTAAVTVTPTVGTPTTIMISSGSDPTCQLTNGTTTTTYSTTAANSTGFDWSLSNGSAGSIVASTGVMTWANGFSGSVDIRVTASGCGTSPQVVRTVNITPAVGTPTPITLSSGTEPTCQLPDGTTTTTYSTTATNSTGFNWSLSNSAAGSIDPATGVMSWANGFSGSVNIQVTATGCGTSTMRTRTVNVTPNVGIPTPVTVSAGSDPACQLTNGTTTTTYSTTASNSTGFTWSLSNPAAGTINPATGVMTWTNGFSGNVNIQVYATGCNGSSPQVFRSVSVTPGVGTPTPITVSGGSEPNCQVTAGTTMAFYSTTATNSTGFNWSVSNGAAGSINPSTGLMTWANGFSGSVDIRVTATGCGTSPMVTRTVTVNPLPVITITGPATPRITSSGNIYETQTGMSGYSWSLSGGGSGTITGNSIAVNWNTLGNQAVSVNYIDSEGCTAVEPKIYNVVIRPLPAASGAAIAGYPSVGNPLAGTYTYNDGSSGSDESTFRWLRNGTDPIPLATGTTYVPTIDDINKTLTFEVTPVSSVGPPYSGSVIKSAPTDLVEDLTGMPVADEVCIEGIRSVGNIIRGEYRYTFTKAEGVSTFRWLRKEISTGICAVIGTSKQYVLTPADMDDTREIIFEVTPVSSNLTPIPGDPVQSRPLARILIPKTEYSVSEPDVLLSANEPGGVFSGSGVSGNIFSPASAGSAGSPYTLTYLLNIVNTSSSCSQQASKQVIVNPNVSSFVGFDPVYCHNGGNDVITVTGVPSGSTDLSFTLTNSSGIISSSGTSVTIDPGRMRPGANNDILYFSYRYLGTFYQISQAFTIDSVGTDIRIINLDSAFCKGDAKKYLSVEGVYPAGGTATWTGDILSDTKPASAYADPSLGTQGVTYPITYQYRSASGCYSKLLRHRTTINPLPDAAFALNPTYNIAGGQVNLVPVQTGGLFSGNGVSGDKLFPDIAGLGEHEIKYTITDTNFCSANLGKKTTIRQAQGTFTDIPSVICYSDTTYNIRITGLPSGIAITGFTNTKNTIIYTPGETKAGYYVPDAGGGPDTLIFTYLWDGVSYTISKILNIDNLGEVQIKNLTPGQIICNNLAPYELFPSVPGGIFSGPVSGSYLDPLKATGPASVTYTYTNLKTGCSTSTSVPITIFPAPKVEFHTTDVCIESEQDTTIFINNTISDDLVSTWLWKFTEEGETREGYNKDERFLFKKGGLHKVSLTATTVNNCAVTKEVTIDLGRKPVADFFWEKDCMHPGDSVRLIDATIFSSPIVSRSWRFPGETEFSNKRNTSYLKSDTGYLRIKYVVRTSYENCSDEIIKDVYIRPAIVIQSDGYFENFESGKSGWVKGYKADNSWSFGKPDRPVINSASSGRNAWYTGYDMTTPRRDTSSIVSPCFDFSTTERPEIKLSLWRRFEKERDGAALQYKTDNSRSWQYVGTINDGIEWYNSAVIRGRPGGDQLGWTTIGTPDNDWVVASHTLDELKGKKDVKFRIVYGSDGFYSDHDGMAFDDIWIGGRNRRVLFEHFINLPDIASSNSNVIVNTIATNKKEDVINIQYHTNFPGADPFYNSNPGDASARILYYGLTRVPYTFIDGGTKKNFASIFDNDLAKIDSNDVAKRSLIPSPFNIIITPSVFGGVLSVSGQITALDNINADNLTLYLAVTEKINKSFTGALGVNEYKNVFRKFLPDAGGIILKNNWTKGESASIAEKVWQIDRVLNASDIEIIAFIQNNNTKEVYQATSVIKPNIVVGFENLNGKNGNGFTVYPNPAVNNLTIEFEQPPVKETDIRIIDLRGVVVASYKAGPGVYDFRIENLSLKAGIYLVRLSAGGIDYGFRKLVVSRD
jgi:hypothetical protein